MTGVVAALSLSEQMKTLGAYAGFAAVLGLAVLAALYIAQAREVRRLREWAGDAPERDPSAAAVPPPTPVPPAAPPAGGAKQTAAAVARVAAAPVGAAAATAVAAARKAGKGAAAAESQPGSSAAAAGAAKPAPVPGAAPVAKPAPAPQPAKAGPAPATAAAKSAGPATAVVTAPPPSAGAAAKPGPVAGNVGAARAPQAASKAVPPRTPAAGGPGAVAAPAPGGQQGHGRYLPFVAGAVVVFLIILGGVQLLTGDDDGLAPVEDSAPQPASPAVPSRSGSSARTPGINRKSVTVAVLNGTTTDGLARGAANRLQRSGYRIGQVTNATDNSRAATTISYAPGFRRAALDVARVVRVATRSVAPIDAATRVVAGQDALVVVTVGADQGP